MAKTICSPMHPGTEIETLAGERTKVILSTLGVGTADTGHTLEIVAARREPVTELLDALKAVPAVLT